ncbi:AAA family ATPase [Ornithinimicrobium pekingense]|uniref:Response regulatory domain-containing protein n=1 Tax=Ornithinimicrobium pekingense TaxID=384677 RepID=A0ABQ2FBE4_9MICO|nr:AAA family ATPase [Ornithinimicrobium pekingense]GGK80461.1 hypothetical protein GCM10011509_31200 [Ornithinimicrobium pekingense]
MKKRLVLGIADQTLTTDLLTRIEALEDFEVVHVSESTQELLPAVLNHDPDVLVLDRHLPPGPISRVTHDLSVRRPALPMLLATRAGDEDALSLALEVGARGVLAYPFVLAEVNDALTRATEWGERMREVLTGGVHHANVQGGVVTFAGSKGGVGTTILTVHTAWRLAQQHQDKQVCLVDLDLEKGDVPSYVDLSYRVSIVDLAKIADDMTDRVVRDTVAVHESGLHILPAPIDVRDADVVSASAIRSILSQLRQMYDVVLVDAGSNVTPAQAAAVEMSDHVIQVVTTDVPSLRAARRQSQSWIDLGVRGTGDLAVLVNRYSRDSEIQQSTIDRLVLGSRLEVLVPELGRGLEAAVNTRTPSHNAPKSWWKALDAVVAETAVVPAPPAEAAASRRLGVLGRRPGKEPPAPAPATARAAAESGQVSLETVGVLPVTVAIMVLLWQLVGMGLSFVWAGHAANAAAREASLGSSSSQVVQAAREAVPAGVHGNMQVDHAGDQVQVRIKVAPVGSGSSTVPVDVSRGVTTEPRG